MVSILELISSRNWQQLKNITCNEIFLFKRIDCYECSCIYWRTAIYKRGRPEQSRQNMAKLVTFWNHMYNTLCNCQWFLERLWWKKVGDSRTSFGHDRKTTRNQWYSWPSHLYLTLVLKLWLMMITGKNRISKDLWKTWERWQREILWYQESSRFVFNLEKDTTNKSKTMDGESVHFTRRNFLQSKWL